jgi:hypothetical protein
MAHANAALTPRARLKMARLIVDHECSIARAAERFQVSCVNGHGFFPSGGHEFSPMADVIAPRGTATGSPRWVSSVAASPPCRRWLG